MARTRVLLAEDNADAARVIAALIDQEPDLVCAGIVASAGEVLGAVEAGGPDALLLDLQLGDESGIPVLNECRARFPRLVVVVLSGHDGATLKKEVRARGAHDYLVKPNDLEVLVPRLRSALQESPR